MTTVVAIHGVGDPAPGSVISLLSGVGDQSAVKRYHEESILVAGTRYPALRGDGDEHPAFVEVNWSDVRRPFASLAGVVRHLALLLIAILYLGASWHAEDDSERGRAAFPSLYRVFLVGFTFWSAFVPMFDLLSRGLDGADRVAFVVLFNLSIVGVAYALGTRGSAGSPVCPLFRAGYAWAAAFLTLGLFNILASPTIASATTRIATGVYELGQFGAALLLVIAAAEILLARGSPDRTLTHRVTRLAFIYTPVLAIATAGPVLMSIAMRFPTEERVSAWSEDFVSYLHYDLTTAEVVMTIAVGSLGLFTLVGLVSHVAWTSRGATAQNWLAVTLLIAPVVLSVAGVLVLASMALGSSGFGPVELDGIDVYKYSALRIFPIIPLFLRPLSIVLDVTGDVVFYLLPSRHPLSSAGETQRRLHLILTHLTLADRREKVKVLAHSQGSVIAADVMSEIPSLKVDLVTVGSPVESLHKRFLGRAVGGNLGRGRPDVEWLNLYRSGDFIAGEISRASSNECIGAGGHTGYWDDSRIQLALRS